MFKTKTLSSRTKTQKSKNQKHDSITDWLKNHYSRYRVMCSHENDDQDMSEPFNDSTINTQQRSVNKALRRPRPTKCSCSFTNTNFTTKNNKKTRPRLKNESRDVSRTRLKSRAHWFVFYEKNVYGSFYGVYMQSSAITDGCIDHVMASILSAHAMHVSLQDTTSSEILKSQWLKASHVIMQQ